MGANEVMRQLAPVMIGLNAVATLAACGWALLQLSAWRMDAQYTVNWYRNNPQLQQPVGQFIDSHLASATWPLLATNVVWIVIAAIAVMRLRYVSAEPAATADTDRT